MKLHAFLIIASTCFPVFASSELQHMMLVCSEGEHKFHFVPNNDGSPKVVTGNFEVDNEKFEKAHAEYQKAIARYEILEKKVDEENARNLKEKERIFREINEQYDLEVAQWNKNKLLSQLREFGGWAVPIFGSLPAIYAFMKLPPLSVLVGTGTYMLFQVGYKTYVPELPNLPIPSKKGGSYPGEIGIEPPPREPKSSEKRFQVFVARLADKKNRLCAAGEVMKVQDVADGFLYPIKMQD